MALRRRLRAIEREVAAEQTYDVTLGLRRLVARRVSVAAVRAAVHGGEVVEFRDGTSLELDVREGGLAFEHLGSWRSGAIWLSGVAPIFGHCWYRLRFSSSAGRAVEVLARVDRLESADSRYSRDAGRRGHRFGDSSGVG